MKNEFAWIHDFNSVSAAVTEQLRHDLNLKKQETREVKREVSCAKMMGKRMYLRTWIYYGVSKVCGRALFS
jgi:hypothetical protein